MTAILKMSRRISPEEYLHDERSADIRHEYVNGQVYAMAGASDDHNRIAGNIFAALHSTLSNTRGEAFINDMKVKIPPTFADVFYYPDVIVACTPKDNAKYYRECPAVIFEVISPETERIDRRERVLSYRQIPTLRAYVMMEQDRMAATVLRRAKIGWESEALEGPEAVLRLGAIGFTIRLEAIYARTALASPKRSRPGRRTL
jgi:Uma2 family endonuclease